MAENTYKKPKIAAAKKNRRKGEEVEEVEEESQPRKPFLTLSFAKDRRFQHCC